MTVNTSNFWITEQRSPFRRQSMASTSSSSSSSTNSTQPYSKMPSSPFVKEFKASFKSKSPTHVTQYMHRVWENESRLRPNSPPSRSSPRRLRKKQPVRRYSQSHVEFERRRSIETAFAMNETSFESHRFREGFTAANTEPPSIMYHSPLLRGQN
eukprot:CAMPEP_0117425582 /NCGR_PEP_ID=MMETSP0758-20121206/5839_1 /TAXON_ID=63605 /ORGANISM="Percolomonas cosmopolitus, Strain AE-1 (ATCC 50343)" /LENGTH=154 /DNA_ID=CAMNT_0005210181 /DNA_START=457 /DNA_END=918 /DNA_ORIENTATION=+